MKRRFYSGHALQNVQSIEEMRELAKRRLPDFAWQYIESGSEDEHTLRCNRAVFRDYTYIPRTLVDTSVIDSTVKVFGRTWPFPLIVGPTGFNGLAWPGGDVSLARAAASLGIPFTLSTFANQTLEHVGSHTAGEKWFQLYVLENQAITDSLVQRARDCGYRALVVTTDANVSSSREWQRRCYRAPGTLTVRHQLEIALHPAWLYRFAASCVQNGLPIFANLQQFFDRRQLSATRSAPLIT